MRPTIYYQPVVLASATFLKHDIIFVICKQLLRQSKVDEQNIVKAADAYDTVASKTLTVSVVNDQMRHFVELCLPIYNRLIVIIS